MRDAGALTVQHHRRLVRPAREGLHVERAAGRPHARRTAWTQELRLSGGKRPLQVGGRRLLLRLEARVRPEPDRRAATRLSSRPDAFATTRTVAPKDYLFFSDLNYKLRQYALFGEGTFAVTNQFSVTAGLRYYHYKEDKAQIFDGLFGAGADGNPQSQPGTAKADGVAPRFIASYKVTDTTTLNAQASKGFRLGGINDPLNCESAARPRTS